jgi:hypothetical protein
VVANPTNPFDSPEPIVIGKFFNRINGFPPSQIITTDPCANNVLRFALNLRGLAHIRI